jgi:hypothetical protein
MGLDHAVLGSPAVPRRARVAAKSGWARWFTIIVLFLNLLAQLSWLGNSGYPLWSLTIVTLEIVVLYALTVRWKDVSTLE